MTLHTLTTPLSEKRRRADGRPAIDRSSGPAAFSLAEAVAEIVTRARAGEPFALAAHDIMARWLDGDLLTVAGRGLASIGFESLRSGGDRAADEFAERDGSAGRLNPRTHPGADYWRVLLAEPGRYQGADGVRKALLDFTLADVQALGADMGGKAAAALRVQAAMERAAAALAHHHKSRIGDLPEKAQREIAERLI